MADMLFNVGADNFALEIYLKLELYTEAAHVLFKQNKAKFEYIFNLENFTPR